MIPIFSPLGWNMFQFIRERSLSMAHIGEEEILSEELKIP